MRAQRQLEETVIVDDFLARRHGGERDVGLARGRCAGAEQRQVLVIAAAAKRLHRPQRVAARETERAEGIGIGQPLDDARRKPGAQPQIAQGVVGFTLSMHGALPLPALSSPLPACGERCERSEGGRVRGVAAILSL